MKILLLTPQLPYPPHQGTSLRNYHLLRGLAGRHDLTLLSFVEADGNSAVDPKLSALCTAVQTVVAPQRSSSRRLIQMISRSEPDMALRLTNDSYASALEDLLEANKYDLVQIEGIELAWTIPLIRAVAPRVRIVYDAHNAETLLQERSAAADWGTPTRWPAAAYSFVQSRRLATYEAWACREVDWVTAVSEADSQALQELIGPIITPVTVIPNSIDVQEFADVAGPGPNAKEFAFDIVFSGKMDYRPNIDAVLWFADHVWPLIRQQRPQTSWAIVGQKPHERLSRLQDLPGVTVTGWVQEVAPFLNQSKVFIMPFRVGSGTRLKVIQAFAGGCAVVSTAVGVEGFQVENGRHLLIADTAETFARDVLLLLDDSNLRASLGNEAQQFAQAYDWRTVVPRFDAVYETLLKAT